MSLCVSWVGKGFGFEESVHHEILMFISWGLSAGAPFFNSRAKEFGMTPVHLAVSMNWGLFVWVSLSEEPDYVGSRLGPLISGNSHLFGNVLNFSSTSLQASATCRATAGCLTFRMTRARTSQRRIRRVSTHAQIIL